MPDEAANTWTVLWTNEGMRSLRRVPPRILPAVMSFADDRLAVNPLRATHRLNPPLDRYRSGSVGSFRVLIEVNSADNIIYVVKVAYHADVYRPRS